MNTFRKVKPAVVGALSLFLLPAASSFGQTTATTDPVGYTALALPANSDSLISIPFTRPAAFVGAIGAVSTTNNVTTITTASAPGWMAHQYQYAPTAQPAQTNTYYAIIGPKLATVSGTVTVTNGQTTVSATAGLSTLQPNDELIVNGLAYNVASVTNDTALVLSRPYTGTTASGQTATYDRSPKEGSFYTVTDNGTNTLTVNLNGDSLSSVAVGTTVSLIPYWTLGTAFPAGDAGVSYTTSSSTGSKGRGTQILLPDLTSSGVNLASKLIYYSYNDGSSITWQLVGASDLSNYYNDVILPPTTYFTVRNAGTQTTFTPTGGVYMNRLSVPLASQTGGGQDNAVAVTRPASVTLNDLGLISSGAFTPSNGTGSKQRTDTLLTYNNATVGTNKAATGIYFYYSGVWYSSNDPGVDHGTDAIPYGSGFTIRKANGTGATAFWQNTRNY